MYPLPGYGWVLRGVNFSRKEQVAFFENTYSLRAPGFDVGFTCTNYPANCLLEHLSAAALRTAFCCWWRTQYNLLRLGEPSLEESLEQARKRNRLRQKLMHPPEQGQEDVSETGASPQASWSQGALQTIPLGEVEEDKVTSLAFSPDGAFLALGTYLGAIKLWSIGEGRWAKVFQGHETRVEGLAFSADGQVLASGAEEVRLWSIPGGRLLKVLKEKLDFGGKLAFSPDGRWLAVSSLDRVHLWKVWECCPAQTLKVPTGGGVAFSPNGGLLALGRGSVFLDPVERENGSVLLFRVSDWALVKKLSPNKNPSSVSALAFSSDGTFLATGDGEGNVALWNVADGALLRPFAGAPGRILSLAFAKNGEFLLGASSNGWFYIWEVASGKLLGTFKSHEEGVANALINGDGTLVATVDRKRKTVALWRIEDIWQQEHGRAGGTRR
jgi:WD40 repeat protein